MSWRTWTKVGLFGALAVIVCYDVLAMVRGGVDATISRVTLAWVQTRAWGPVIPAAVGFLCGHLFWSQPCQRVHLDAPRGTLPTKGDPPE